MAERITLIFDLDGTLSDPRDGIVRSINHALTANGHPSRPEHDLERYIGPPLDQAFVELTGIAESAHVHALVAAFRERYGDVGYAENTLYEGIEEALRSLAGMPRVRLGVCSSKRVDFVERILRMFGLFDLFAFVSGGDVGIEKWQQLQRLYVEADLSPCDVMIGDRAVDLIAARRNGLHSAGVLWGYGSIDELRDESPCYLLSRILDLQELAGSALATPPHGRVMGGMHHGLRPYDD